MKIAGLVKTSLIDYPGQIAAVIFTPGCNFSCGFCHNPDLVPLENMALGIPEGEVLEFLESRIGKLDGVVVTGGEPTIQKDLLDFLKKLKKMGYLVKLDTNGSNPGLLKESLKKKLVDYVAMDVKGSPKDYERICGYTNLEAIRKSIDIILNSKIDYEFRTTTLPFYHKILDFNDLGKMIKGAERFTIQGFRPEITLNSDLSDAKKFTQADLEEIARIMRKYVKEVVIHKNF